MVKLADTRPKVGRESTKLEDVLDMAKLPKNKWVAMRMLPLDLLPVKRHWINIIAGKDRREVKIPKICLSFDPATEGTIKGVKCPYDDLATGGQGEIFYLANVIVRQEQEDQPAKMRKHTAAERESGFKEPGSESWTPVRVVRLTSSLTKKIQGLQELNKHKLKAGIKTFDVSDARYGVDINIKHDPDAKGAEQYQVNLGDKNALTEEENAYLVHELSADLLDKLGRETVEEARRELKGMKIVGDEDMDGGDEDDEDDDIDIDIDIPAKGRGKPAAKSVGKKKPVDEDDDEDEDDEDEDDDHVPAKSAAKKPVGKKKPVDEDEDDEDEDDEDEDDEDEDEDDEPPARKKPVGKPAAKPVGKKKPVDEDDEDDEDEDEDDEPPARKKPAAKPAAKPVGKKKPVDEDEDDEDEDEDDEPPARKKPAAKKPVGKKKPVDEDEDEDEDDEDEDDEPPARKKPAAKPAAKSVGKKKPVDEDEDEDDEPPARKKPAAKPAAKKPVGKKKPVDEDDDEDDIPF